MKKLVYLLIFTFTYFSYAQNDVGGNTITDGFQIRASSEKGTPYLLPEWVSGYVVDLEGNLSEQKKLNYNIYENVLTFKAANTGKIMAIDPAKYSGFVLTDANKKDYLFTKVSGDEFTKSKKETQFYQIVVPPSKNVLLETKKNLNDPNKSGWISSQNTTKRAEYETEKTYYVLAKDNKYTKINLKNSSVLKAFKDKKNEISAYIKSNNININSPADVEKIAEYYHSL